MSRFALAALLCFVLLGQARAASTDQIAAPPIAFQSRTLSNGLKVITSQDRTTPNVTVQVFYRVGAKNDPEGRSGFAHLFEHMMFKATDQMPAEYMDRLTEDAGGMNNAFTMDDATGFFDVIPASQLQRLLWAEADRMSSLVVDDANFRSEREVVKEELRQRVLADPYGRLFHYLIPAATFQVHPYKRAAIGSIEDLDAATLDDVRSFHATFYRPDNAVLVVVGNFDPAQLDAWIDTYFGALKVPANPVPQVTVTEPARTGPKTVTGYGSNVPLPAVVITWLAPNAASPDSAALTVLDAILTGGKSSRLYDSLVYDKQIAQQVFSSADLRQQLGMFYVGAVAAQGHGLDEVTAALQAQVAAVRNAPVTPAQLESAKTQLIAGEIRNRETIDGRASELALDQVVEGDAGRANSDITDLQQVTAADVQRVAQTYLADDRRTEIRYLPQAPTAAPAANAAPPAAPPAPVAAPIPPGPPAALPPAGPQPAALLPSPRERTLANGLRVIVAKSTDLPLVAADLFVMAGAETDPPGLAGAADLTADMVTEGAGARSARDIARETESMGANLSASAGWEVSSVGLSVMPVKLAAALPIMADVVRRPTLSAAEFARARRQSLDDLQLAYEDPDQVSASATAPVIYAGTPFAHAASGTPASLARLTRADITRLQRTWWRPDNAILVLTGDITPERGFALAQKVFGDWARPPRPLPPRPAGRSDAAPRAVAIGMPGAGQATVVVTGPAIARTDPRYYAGLVANAVLGGGYSARLNEEIRVKRGLSYGASSSLTARRDMGAFTAQVQTRNETAAEVIGLIKAQMSAVAAAPPTADELAARKASLVGDYGRALGTTAGLAADLGDLALYGLDLNEIGAYTGKVQAVTGAEAQGFAAQVLTPDHASVIIAGDPDGFLAPLKADYPNLELIPIGEFDPENATLKAGK